MKHCYYYYYNMIATTISFFVKVFYDRCEMSNGGKILVSSNIHVSNNEDGGGREKGAYTVYSFPRTLHTVHRLIHCTLYGQ